jgi:hypothetical protein
MIIFAIIGCIAALIAIVSVIFAIAKWVSKLEANTGATERLTTVFEHFVEKVGITLEDHSQRLTRLETKYEYFENGQMNM